MTSPRMTPLGGEVHRDRFAGLAIGDERAAVRHRFGEYRVFRRSPDSPETDHFVGAGLQVTCSDAGLVVFVDRGSAARAVRRRHHGRSGVLRRLLTRVFVQELS